LIKPSYYHLTALPEAWYLFWSMIFVCMNFFLRYKRLFY
jgi:hypothetical protein